MDLNLTAEEQQFRDEVRGWLMANVPPPDAAEGMAERFDAARAWQRQCYDAGWAGISWPKDYGGRSATAIEQVIFVEEMTRARAPRMANSLGLALIGPTIIHYGTEDQKQRYLSKILSAEEIWCQGFSEPNSGSDLASLRTEARLDGDHFIVNGQKVWTSLGNFADWCALVTRTAQTDPPHKGLTYLLVDMRSPGVEVRPLRQMTGESEFCEVFFENVRVPASNMLGKMNEGWKVAISTLAHERTTLGVDLQIIFRRNLDRLLELAHATMRNGKPASEDPVIRQKMAQCYAEISIMRLNQMRAISRLSRDGVPGPEGSILKLFWSELNQRFQQVAQEVLGPYGLLDAECALAPDQGAWSYGFLRARGNTIEAGTSEIQRSIIGHFVLGLPKSY